MEKKTAGWRVVDRVHLSNRDARVAAVYGQLLTSELSRRRRNIRAGGGVHSLLVSVWMEEAIPRNKYVARLRGDRYRQPRVVRCW